MMLYLDNAATTLKSIPSVYPAFLRVPCFERKRRTGGYKMSMDAIACYCDTQDLIAQL